MNATTVPFDLTIRNESRSTERQTWFADIGARDGGIAAIAVGPSPGRRDIDGRAHCVLQGGLDCHRPTPGRCRA